MTSQSRSASNCPVVVADVRASRRIFLRWLPSTRTWSSQRGLADVDTRTPGWDHLSLFLLRTLKLEPRRAHADGRGALTAQATSRAPEGRLSVKFEDDGLVTPVRSYVTQAARQFSSWAPTVRLHHQLQMVGASNRSSAPLSRVWRSPRSNRTKCTQAGPSSRLAGPPWTRPMGKAQRHEAVVLAGHPQLALANARSVRGQVSDGDFR